MQGCSNSSALAMELLQSWSSVNALLSTAIRKVVYDWTLNLLRHPIPCLNSSPPSAAYMRRRIYVSVNQVNIDSDNGLLPIRHQAIIQTSAGLLSIGPLGINFGKISIEIQNFSLMKMYLKILSVKMAAILSRGRWANHWAMGHLLYILANWLWHSTILYKRSQ